MVTRYLGHIQIWGSRGVSSHTKTKFPHLSRIPSLLVILPKVFGVFSLSQTELVNGSRLPSKPPMYLKYHILIFFHLCA